MTEYFQTWMKIQYITLLDVAVAPKQDNPVDYGVFDN